MYINGPAGQLEARIDPAKVEKPITAVLCHPHPLYGGSMHDLVLDTVAAVLLDFGVNCMRFNFRGVGESDGEFDHGNGEVLDLMAVIDWLREEYPRDKLWLVGYSFGAHVVWTSLAKSEPDRAFLVAPPTRSMQFEEQARLDNITVFAGDLDEHVDSDRLAAWDGVECHVIRGADHFFSGYQERLAEAFKASLDGGD